ncbi:MAG: hypothetical protein V3T83_12170, partial [Acidobacteriota bacterium]
VVFVVNLGTSNELFLQLLGFDGLALAGPLPQPQEGPLGGQPLLAGGNILFNDNQVVLDGLDLRFTYTFSSIALFSLDDIVITGNQCDSDLPNDLLLTQLLAWGWSLRCTGNRFKESLNSAFLSAITIGLVNTTADNQGTHCFVRVAQLPQFGQNTVVGAALLRDDAFCQSAQAMERQLSQQLFGLQT